MTAKLGNESWLAFVGIATGGSLPKKPEIPLKTPACVVAAGGDTIIPLELEEKLAERLGVKAHIIPNTTHDLMLAKNWEESAKVFLGWIESLYNIFFRSSNALGYEKILGARYSRKL